MASHSKCLERIIMSGDKAQLTSISISEREKECHGPEAMSLLDRLIVTELRDIQLLEQYRMAPGIDKFVSDQFYDGSLITDTSCN